MKSHTRKERAAAPHMREGVCSDLFGFSPIIGKMRVHPFTKLNIEDNNRTFSIVSEITDCCLFGREGMQNARCWPQNAYSEFIDTFFLLTVVNLIFHVGFL